MTTQAKSRFAVRNAPAIGLFLGTLLGTMIFAAYVTAFFGKPDSLSELRNMWVATNALIFLPAVALAFILGPALHTLLTRLKRTSEYHYIAGGALLGVTPAILWSQLALSAKQQAFGPALDLAIVILGGVAVGALIAFLSRQFVRDTHFAQALAKSNPRGLQKRRIICLSFVAVAFTAGLGFAIS